ncbi:MAG: ATP-binding protein [Candidatus Bathyarchaeia archaeon]
MSQRFFVNREEELEFLEAAYNSRRPEFIIIYGRRRVGKTELILRFLQYKPGLYFLASTEGDRENIANFKAKCSELIKDPSFAEIEFADWFSLFQALSRNVNFLDLLREKLVICIDEFPYLIAGNPAIPSIFQKIYDLILKKLNIMLILCGSSVSVMETEVLSRRSPLYGRRTGQWQLNPLSFVNIKDFLNYDIEDQIKTWFVLGGIPEYLLKFDPALPFWDNVKTNILTKGRYLYDEAEILLRMEFREPRNYKLIFKALVLGKNTLGEICNLTGLDKSMVSKYLDVLKNLRLVREEIPITASPKFKGRLYSLIDPYFNFWFRYVYTNRIDLEAHRQSEVLQRIKADFPNYGGYMFERLIEELLREGRLLRGFSWSRIGKWWHKDEEIDIVALNEQTKNILFAECKWSDEVDAGSILAGLREKAMLVRWRSKTQIYAVFAKSFKEKFKEPGALLFDLKDIEEMLSEHR